MIIYFEYNILTNVNGNGNQRNKGQFERRQRCTMIDIVRDRDRQRRNYRREREREKRKTCELINMVHQFFKAHPQWISYTNQIQTFVTGLDYFKNY